MGRGVAARHRLSLMNKYEGLRVKDEGLRTKLAELETKDEQHPRLGQRVSSFVLCTSFFLKRVCP